ncbi:hypothetical protein GVN24_24790 [Rhizobium sp. CRIBSB]|nr:hypothetical protein [Rhizobium sp. CRIBSB]
MTDVTPSWRTRRRATASFRGVAFEVDSHDHDFGRRTEVHEYALRDDPWVEDLGRLARRYSLDAYLIGPDYDLARAALIRALEAAGPGTLVHPWLGDLTVVNVNASLRESIRRGGEAGFRLDFVEAGQNLAPELGEDTQAVALDAAALAGEQAAASLTSGLGVDGQPGFVADAAAARIGEMTLALESASAPLRSASASAGAFLRRAARVRSGALDLVRTPGDLATELLGLVRDAAALATTPRAALAALMPLTAFGSTLDAVLGDTPARRRERANQTALADFLRQAAAASAAAAIVRISFDARDQAATARDSLADRMDAVARDAADAGDDAAFLALETARRAMVRDVTRRAGDLAQIFGHVVTTDRPLLVVAHDLYGDAGRDLELAARNRPPHPGFIAAGTVLQALADGGEVTA